MGWNASEKRRKKNKIKVDEKTSLKKSGRKEMTLMMM